ncbi:MAG: ankyrin-like [Chlamydiales bacterium]|jgi:ankyrin repeat protein|nr:ankyrin-like [Chlamydiales bacterium]
MDMQATNLCNFAESLSYIEHQVLDILKEDLQKLSQKGKLEDTIQSALSYLQKDEIKAPLLLKFVRAIPKVELQKPSTQKIFDAIKTRNIFSLIKVSEAKRYTEENPLFQALVESIQETKEELALSLISQFTFPADDEVLFFFKQAIEQGMFYTAVLFSEKLSDLGKLDLEVYDRYARGRLLLAAYKEEVFSPGKSYHKLQEKIWELSPNINAVDNRGDHLFKVACTQKNEQLALRVIRSGLSINESNQLGFTPLALASLVGLKNVVNELLQKGADPSLSYPQSNHFLPVHIAAKYGSLDIVQKLVECCPQVISKQDADGNSALHHAAFCEKAQVLEYLLQKGADPYLRNRLSLTPLHISSERGFIAGVAILIQQAPDLINTGDFAGLTPLLYAINGVHLDLLELLLKKGVDINQPSQQGVTPLLQACFNMHEKENEKRKQLVYKLLSHKNINLTANSSSGANPLRCVLCFGEAQLLNLLFNNNPIIVNLEWEEIQEFYSRVALLDSSSLDKVVAKLQLALLSNNRDMVSIIQQNTDADLFKDALCKIRQIYTSTDCAILDSYQLKINGRHYSRNLSRVIEGINHSKATPHIKLEGFSNLLEQINFEDRTSPHYYNPEKILEQGLLMTPDMLKDDLQRFLARVKDRIPFLGTPSANKPEQLNAFYDRLEFLSKNVLQALDALTPQERTADIIDIAIATALCGERHIAEFEQIYQRLCLKQELHSFDDILLKFLQDLRLQIIQGKMVNLNDEQSTHIYHTYLRILAPEIGLPTRGLNKFSDLFAKPNTLQHLLKVFYQFYTPEKILEEVQTQIESFFSGTLSQDMMLDWIKWNLVSLDWKKEEYSEIGLEVNKMINKECSQNQILKFLMTKGIAIPTDTPLTAYPALIENARRIEYMQEELYDMNTGKLKRETIIKILQKLEVLQMS